MNRIMVTRLMVALFAFALSSSPVWALLHLIQIEQVIVGVNGEHTAQAIQFRMRATNQGSVGAGSLFVWDAEGKNPILITDFAGLVFPNSNVGNRVLLVSPNFVAFTDPPVVPN